MLERGKKACGCITSGNSIHTPRAASHKESFATANIRCIGPLHASYEINHTKLVGRGGGVEYMCIYAHIHR